MKSPFNVSDKVICIDDEMTDVQRAWSGNTLVKDRVYVVRETFESGERNIPAVRVVGVNCKATDHGAEIGWNASRFRLLAEVRAENAARAVRTIQ